MEEHKERSEYMLPKEHLVHLKLDDGLFEHIEKIISDSLANRIIQILDAEDEIALRQTDLKAEEYLPTNSIIYKKAVFWSSIVRCKNCSYYDDMCWCDNHDEFVDKNDYCSKGERRKSENDAM